jgi:hypothetical protein
MDPVINFFGSVYRISKINSVGITGKIILKIVEKLFKSWVFMMLKNLVSCLQGHVSSKGFFQATKDSRFMAYISSVAKPSRQRPAFSWSAVFAAEPAKVMVKAVDMLNGEMKKLSSLLFAKLSYSLRFKPMGKLFWTHC